MGEATNDEGNANSVFFYQLVRNIADEYPAVFGGGGRVKPHSPEYRQFSQDWGFQKILLEMANEDITKVAEIYQLYLSDVLLWLTFNIKKNEVQDIEDKWQDQLRKAKRGGR